MRMKWIGIALLLMALGLGWFGVKVDGLKAVPAFSYAAESGEAAANINLFAPPQSPQPSQEPSPQSSFSIEVVGTQDQKKGSILIYHTHTYEAYEQTQDRYVETEKWRTADEKHNVVRVGEELCRLLRALGYTVEHDRNAYEPPNLSSSYARSLAMLEKRAQDGESYDLYIDLHRDAYTASQSGSNHVNIGGQETARLMLLIGKGEGQTSEGFAQKPDWESNLALANAITDAINDQANGLCKGVRLKNGRFNQHIAPRCVLVEVGNNRNTLSQALSSLPYLADAIAGALETPETP